MLFLAAVLQRFLLHMAAHAACVDLKGAEWCASRTAHCTDPWVRLRCLRACSGQQSKGEAGAAGEARTFKGDSRQLGPAYAHAVYGSKCSEHLQFVALTHMMLRNNGSTAALVVLLGEGCPAEEKARAQLRAGRTGAQLHRLTLVTLDPTAFGPYAIRPSRSWVDRWLPKLSGIAVFVS